jgi:lipoprotein-anchoring transpeptidase ErfK/SrfK
MPTGVVDTETWRALNADSAPAVIQYTVTAEDAAGPFVEIPGELPEQAKLKSLAFCSLLEKLAETFHASEELLRAMNPGATFDREGEAVWVPNVITATPRPAARVVVSKADLRVTALDESGNVIASYPASVGSEHDPLPIGEWKVTGVHENPIFYYNPELFWDADPTHSRAKIAPGPNNPVGVVWIDLTKEHYGLHGTPAPRSIGHKQSHGCVRLTNWDAWELAHMIAEKVPVTFQE